MSWLQALGGWCVASLVLVSAVQAELKVGDPAPDFKLVGSDGKTYQLADFKGKQPVVVAWFPKAFTGGCTRECSSLRAKPLAAPLTITLLNGQNVELAASPGSGLDKFDVAYFTASCDTQEMNAKYAAALQLDYPILCDPSKATARAYGVVDDMQASPRRWTFYISKEGKIAHIDKQVNAAAHAAQIVERLKALGVAAKP
jgi:peroxiredoxin Q/BCP